MIVGEPSPWTQAASELLKQFIETPAGQVFLAQLAAQRPGLMTGTPDATAVALQASYVAGYESAVNTILTLTEPPITKIDPSQDNYPPLDDDKAWGAQP